MTRRTATGASETIATMREAVAHATDADLSDYVLEIRSGLYEGVTHGLDAGRHVFGSGDGADLVLLESGLAPAHATVVLRNETIRVEGLAEGVAVEGAGPVPFGSARTVRLPARIAIGGVETVWRAGTVAVARPAAHGLRARMRGLLRRPAAPGFTAAGFLAVTVFMTIADPIADASVLTDGSPGIARAHLDTAGPVEGARTVAGRADASAAQVGRPAGAVPHGPGPAEAAGSAPPRDTRTVAAALARQAKEAGLPNVRVSASDGAVAATGTIEPSMSGRWQALQKDFDERFGGEITLVNGVVAKAEALPASLGIEGVWRGPQPYVVIRGQRYLVGAVLDGGWAIRGLERDRVMLERQGRLVAMRF